MEKYTEMADEAEISLDASRNRLMQGAYWPLRRCLLCSTVPSSAQILRLTS
jgi:hypothetical protein